MSMMDLYTHEQALEALEEAEATKQLLTRELDKINIMIIFLQYYLNTGEALDPEALGIEPPTEEELDDE